jgi:hypothetical protein
MEPATTLLYALDEKHGDGLDDNYNPTSPSIIHHWPLPASVISAKDSGLPELDILVFPAIPYLEN